MPSWVYLVDLGLAILGTGLLVAALVVGWMLLKEVMK